MALDVYDDYEQGERVRQWLANNWASIALGIAFGLALIFGWQWWKSHRAGLDMEAAQQYDLVTAAIAKGDTTQADAATAVLTRDFPGNVYATLAMSLKAAREVKAGDYKAAASSLQWAAAHSPDKPLQGLMLVRLARVQLALQQPAAALATLQKVDAHDYRSEVAMLQGDAHLAQGNQAAARSAYEQALADMKPDAPQRGLLQLKLDNLAIAGK
ncbi:hypothetical protein B1B_05228 [mine drainage metagenome]|uniref:Ancillary SecYEG translocon subunit n=1 Tax=mine drainage metagenome TaxID=410659 RepID=T1CNC8_9ZZZZ